MSLYTNREFGLVADWVELFGAHIAKTLLPARWPDGPGSTAVLDALPFALSGHINAATGFPMHGGVAAWTVLAAATYIGSELLIVRLRAVPGAPDAHDWAELLVSLPGVPQRTVTDIDNAILAGIRLAWPNAIRLIAWDKLRRRLVEADDSAVKKDKRHRVDDVLAQCAADAFEGRRQWINFARWARVSPRPAHTNAWLRRHARRVHTQLRAMPYWPGDSGPLEQRLAVLRDFFVERKGMIANQDRTNLLLGLMAVQFNGEAHKRRYRQLIRDQLDQAAGTTPRHNLINKAPRLH